MFTQATISAGETCLFTSLLLSYVFSCKVKVAVSACDTSNGASTLVVLALRKRRSTDTRNTSNSTVCDVESLQSSGNISFFVASIKSLLTASATP